MSEIKHIEQSIRKLSTEQPAKFRDWFIAFDARAWDRQIDADQRAGKLDKLLAEARVEFKAGKARGL